MRIIITVAALILSIIVVNGQESAATPYEKMNVRMGIIKGKIIEKSTNTAMQFSSVAAYNVADSSLVTGTISNADGTFIIKDLPYGKYYVEANFMGYVKVYKSGILITPKQQTIDIGEIYLVESKLDIEEVEIVAEQSHVEYKIDRKVINVGQDINAESGTAVDVLENTPSVNVDIDGNVTLRGSGNFTVLIDGKPSSLSGSDALQQIPASAIRNIELITNPSAKYDPDGMAGIINIISKKSALNGLSGIINASAGTGDKYKSDFLVNLRTDKINYFVGASYRDETYAGSISSTTTSWDNLGVESYDVTTGDRNHNRSGKEFKGGIDYSINESNIVSFSGEIGSYNSGQGGLMKQRIYDEVLTKDEYLLTDNYGERSGNYYNLNTNYTRKFDQKGHELVAFVNYSFRDGKDSDRQMNYPTNSEYEIDTSFLANKIRTGENGIDNEVRAQVDYTKPLGENGRFESGYQFRFDGQEETYIFEKYDPDLSGWLKDDTMSSFIDFRRIIHAVYSTYGNKSGNWSYQLGLRAEYTNREVSHAGSDEPARINRVDLFPTLHLSRSFANNNQLMASYSRRINRPNGWFLEEFMTYMNSNTLRKGNASLQPEYMNSYELQFQKSYGRSFIALESYYKTTVNKIERVQEIFQDEPRKYLMTFENVAKDHSFGFEGMINYAKLKWLNLNASSSVYRYWIEGEINGQEIDTRSNNWNLRLNATFNIKSKTRLQLTTMYNGPSATAQGERGAFFFSNLALKQEFLDRKLSATLQLRDIFGTMRHDFVSYGPNFSRQFEFSREPRVITLSLSYKLNNYKQRNNSMNNGEAEGMGDGDMF